MILVTGATGLLGNCCVRVLLERGQRVRVLVRPGPARRELQGLDVEIVYGELNDKLAIERAVTGCTAVIHSAALIHIGWTRLDEARHVNVEGTRWIVEACRTAGARLIHVSTVDTLPAAAAADRPINETCSGLSKIECTYVISKRESEQVVSEAIATGLDAVIVHPGFMLAPFDWKPSSGQMLLGLARTPVVVAPRGTASVCDARDVAAATVNAIEQGRRGEHYILAGENLSYAVLWEQILLIMKRKRKVFRMKGMIPLVMRGLDAANRRFGWREGVVNGASVAMGNLHHAYDSSKAERELGYHRRPLAQTLDDAWKWLQANERKTK